MDSVGGGGVCVCVCVCQSSQWRSQPWACGFQRRVWVISRASGQTPGCRAEGGKEGREVVKGGVRERGEAVSTPPHHRAAAVCQTEICGCGFGPTDTSLSGGMAYTPHRAHRLIPRLKFTFAPSRLNSHFSSSHNTPLSRDTEMMGFLLAPHAKYVQRLPFFSFYTLILFTTLSMNNS